MTHCVSPAIALRYLNNLERSGVGVVYWNNARLPINEARQHLHGVSCVYLHRGLIYAP